MSVSLQPPFRPPASFQETADPVDTRARALSASEANQASSPHVEAMQLEDVDTEAAPRLDGVRDFRLRGSLQTMDVSTLIQIIAEGRKSGLLRCERGSSTTKIFFLEGRIVAAESTDPRHSLGQYLVFQNLCSEDDLRRGLDFQERTGAFLGGAFTQLGILSLDQLRAALHGKTEEIVYSLFDWQTGSFEFVAQTTDRSSHNVVVKLDLQQTLLRGSLRKDRLGQIRQALPSFRAVPRRTEMPFEEADSRPFTARILSLIDGRRTLAEIELEAHGNEYWIGTEILHLLENGHVVVDACAESGATELRSTIDDTALLMDQGRYVEAVAFLRWHLKRRPERQEYRSLLRQAERRLVESIHTHDLAPSTVLETCAYEGAEPAPRLSPEEYFLLSRIDGTWDVRAIVKVCPMEEVDTLRALARLQKLGLVRDRSRGSAPPA